MKGVMSSVPSSQSGSSRDERRQNPAGCVSYSTAARSAEKTRLGALERGPEEQNRRKKKKKKKRKKKKRRSRRSGGPCRGKMETTASSHRCCSGARVCVCVCVCVNQSSGSVWPALLICSPADGNLSSPFTITLTSSAPHSFFRPTSPVTEADREPSEELFQAC